ncbi:hypothetical protein Mapa_009421 [Marchantia paleacea]|nr:hypothetical protein Mapa_009421 [Marchantia paleacea]
MVSNFFQLLVLLFTIHDSAFRTSIKFNRSIQSVGEINISEDDNDNVSLRCIDVDCCLCC